MRDAYAGGRQITVDILRGYFILNMASAHVGIGLATSILRGWRWVDGATGFVCLAGFVMALSQRAKWERGDGSAAHRWILKRALQIWLISFMLTFFGLSLRVLEPNLTFLADVFHEDRLLAAVVDVATLRLNVPYFGILRMYVWFMLFAFAAVALLRRDLDWVVLAASTTLYLLTQLNDANPAWGWGALPYGQGMFAVTAWQFIFFVGLVVGWRWKELLLPLAQRWRRGLWLTAAIAVAGFLWLAHGYKLAVLAPFHPGDASTYFDKTNLSPALLAYFVCVLGLLTALVTVLRRFRIFDPVLNLVALIGRHSLACYVITCIVQGLSWVVAVASDPHQGKHTLWFALAVALFVLYGLSVERHRRSTRSAAPPGAIVPREG